MAELNLLRRAIKESDELLRRGEDRKALEVLDGAIAQGVQENRSTWIGTLCGDAAVISDHLGDLDLEKRYCEQALAYNPGDALSLYTLADISFRQGNVDAAKDYAARSYETCKKRIELDKGVIEMLLERWPELGA